MIVDYSYSFYSVLSWLVLLVGLNYVYALFGLYIGRNAKRNKYILLILNFLFLVLYIISLFSIDSYNQVEIILLLLIVLAIIVLGIIGGFLYDDTIAIDRSNEFATMVSLFRKTMKVSIILFIGYVFIGITYQMMTHDVKRESKVEYMLDIKDSNTNKYCDSHFSVDKDNDGFFFIACDLEENSAVVTKLSIYFDDQLIHTTSDVPENLIYGGEYLFDFDFDEMVSYSGFDQIAIEIEMESQVKVYLTDNFRKNMAYTYVRVPIWIKE